MPQMAEKAAIYTPAIVAATIKSQGTQSTTGIRDGMGDRCVSASPQDILKSFDFLPESEQRVVAGEIMRRTSRWDTAPLTDDELTLAAESIFLALDEREQQDGDRESK